MTIERSAIGRAFEAAACAHLMARGYRIVQRNFRVPSGEIDIIAWDGEVLCFVEVRGRAEAEHGDPLETISPQKQARVIRAAREYLMTLAQPWPRMRFDAIGIVHEDTPVLVKDAFDDSRVGA
jgi:putative endonuclease